MYNIFFGEIQYRDADARTRYNNLWKHECTNPHEQRSQKLSWSSKFWDWRSSTCIKSIRRLAAAEPDQIACVALAAQFANHLVPFRATGFVLAGFRIGLASRRVALLLYSILLLNEIRATTFSKIKAGTSYTCVCLSQSRETLILVSLITHHVKSALPYDSLMAGMGTGPSLGGAAISLSRVEGGRSARSRVARESRE